jgi:anti-anti-sigma factor
MAVKKTKEKIAELEARLADLGDEGTRGEEKVDVLNQLARIFVGSEPEKGLEYAGLSLELGQKLGYEKGIAQSLLNFGVYYQNTSDYDKALENAKKSLEIFEKIGDRDGMGNCYSTLGVVSKNKSELGTALEYHLKALEIREELGDKGGLATTYLNIGVVYYIMQDANKALEYFLDSQKIFEEFNDKHNLATSYVNAGCAYESLGELDKSLACYLKASELSEEIGNKNAAALSYSNTGWIYSGQGDLDKAFEYQKKALEIFESIGEKRMVAACCSGIGQVFVKQKRFDEALEYLNKGLTLAQKTGARDVELPCLELLSNLYEERQDYKKALATCKEYLELKEKIYSQESSDKINKLKYKYETAQKEKEAEIFRLKNVELETMVAERTAELERELSERKRAENVQSVLLNISQALASKDSLRDLFATIHFELGKLLDTTNFFVALYDEKTDTYTFPYEVDEKDLVEDYTPQQLKKSLTDYVRRQGEPLLVDEELHRFLTDEGIIETVGNLSKMWMGVPLKTGGKVAGVVVVQTYDEEIQYTFDDLSILNFVAEAVSLGVARRWAEEELKEKLAVIQKQQDAIQELSTPVIKVWDGVLVVPLIGVIDTARAMHFTDELLVAISRMQAKIAIIDITGVPTVDSSVASHLLKTVKAVRLQGARCILTGIRPEVAQTVIHLGIDIEELKTMSSLAQGLKWAFTKIENG